MEPNKFEKIMKEQLQDREIRPSSDAWQKVAEQLEVDDRSKSNRFFWWGIAASVIGLLLLSVWYLNTTSSQVVPETEIVNTPKKKAAQPIQETLKTTPDVMDEKMLQKKNEITVALENTKNERTDYGEQGISTKAEIENEVAEDSVIETSIAVTDVSPLNDGAETAIGIKIAEVLAKVDDLEQNDVALTDAEVDSLLLQAQKELFNDRLFRKDHSVDAMVLLADVEEELDQSFRDQIFDKLKTGFLKVRTAVAQRND